MLGSRGAHFRAQRGSGVSFWSSRSCPGRPGNRTGDSQVPAGPAGAPEAICAQLKGRKPCKSSGEAQGPWVGGAGAGQGVQGPGKNKLYSLYVLL